MRLVDADALLSKMEKYSDDNARFQNEYLFGMQQRLETCIELVEDAPTVDAVEVVRCKNCKYWRDTDHTCRGHSLVSPMTADDFCSYGKKDGEHEKAD